MDHPTISGLYIHIPFCQTKCPYCDFYSITGTGQVPDFLAALDQEARLYHHQFPPFDSLFLGGGTPSLLDAAQLGALVASLRRHFDFAPDSEITLEANPDDITSEKLRLFRELGINRLSLGCSPLTRRNCVSWEEDILRPKQRRLSISSGRRVSLTWGWT